jgi:hypothetical protein
MSGVAETVSATLFGTSKVQNILRKSGDKPGVAFAYKD